MAPMFVVMSFSFGLAMYLLVLFAAYNWSGRPLGDAVVNRLKNLLGVFIAGVLYFTLVYHISNLYATEHHAVESFVLSGGGIYTSLFWWGQVAFGSLAPMAILYHPATSGSRQMIATACVLTILGGMAQLYVIVIGGQAFPLVLFPEHEIISSGFNDGVFAQGVQNIHPYSTSIYEVLLGIGGFAIAMLVVTFAVKVLRFLPASLADDVADPHYRQQGN